MEKIAFIDAVGGIAGDMLLGALLDAGADEAYLLRQLEKLDLPAWTWSRKQVKKGDFAGTKIDFIFAEEQKSRHLKEIVKIITDAAFPTEVEEKIIAVFNILAEAEAKVHGVSKDEIHFHEVGAVDTILDICGVVLLLQHSEINTIFYSPLPMGNGQIRCAHGMLPVPSPATAELLNGFEVRKTDIQGETVTPTGIALLRGYHATVSSFPSMTLIATGCGCGTRDGDVPNICRIFLGKSKKDKFDLFRLECTVDDMTGEDLGFLWDRVAEIGVKDMYFTPVLMKKGRPAVKINILADERSLSRVKKSLFEDTTTLGLICQPVDRDIFERHIIDIETPYGPVRFKEAEGCGIKKAKAEYEDLKKIAMEQHIPLSEIRRLADNLYTETKKKGSMKS